jgi:hypothetical protein|tara:strand:+ start:445 stop:783 length:339 start_codon:yes stop_codon:yes gene_type:complete
MKQDQLFDQATQLTTDMHVILQLFTNYRGIDVAKDFFGLSHVYHSVHTHPEKLPKSSWSEARVLKAIRKCEEAGLIQYGEKETGHKWTITPEGIRARNEANAIASRRPHPCK